MIHLRLPPSFPVAINLFPFREFCGWPGRCMITLFPDLDQLLTQPRRNVFEITSVRKLFHPHTPRGYTRWASRPLKPFRTWTTRVNINRRSRAATEQQLNWIKLIIINLFVTELTWPYFKFIIVLRNLTGWRFGGPAISSPMVRWVEGNLVWCGESDLRFSLLGGGQSFLELVGTSLKEKEANQSTQPQLLSQYAFLTRLNWLCFERWQRSLWHCWTFGRYNFE